MSENFEALFLRLTRLRKLGNSSKAKTAQILDDFEADEEDPMKDGHRIGLGLAVLAGFAVGTAIVVRARAQPKPPAYVIIDISETKNADAYIKAVSAVEPNATISAGGHFIVRTNAPIALDGDPPNRFVVIAFDSGEKAKAWYNLQAIKDVNAVRMKVTKSRAFMVDGLTN